MKRMLFLVVVLLIVGCNKIEVSDIPYASVNFKVDLQFQDKELSGIGTAITKTFTKPRLVNERTGYSGIIVISGIDAYYAFEMCCPHEAKKTIKIVDTGAGTAKCPECGSEYDLFHGSGAPASGSSKFRLTRFNVYQSGTDLFISY